MFTLSVSAVGGNPPEKVKSSFKPSSGFSSKIPAVFTAPFKRTEESLGGTKTTSLLVNLISLDKRPVVM